MGAKRSFTDEELLEVLRKVAGGAPPRVADLGPGRAAALPSSGTVIARFGSWSNAVEAAGFPRPKRGRRPRAK
jgi:hypothetical protein